MAVRRAILGALATLPPLLVAVPAASAGPALPIRHVVEIMLENHSFDDLFGGFPGAAGITPSTTLPNPFSGGPPVAPLVAPANEGDVQGGLNNSRAAEISMMDAVSGGYKMDGYTRFPGEGLSSITGFSPSTDANLQQAARRYELADENFQPLIAPTEPNVLMALAGTAHGLATNDATAGGTWNTIFDQLVRSGRGAEMYSGVPASVFAGTIWARLFPPGHFVLPVTSFLQAARLGRLPAFSFVRPGVGYSEEPPEDVGEGDLWLGQLLAAIGASPEWRSTAVFITYDEGGGFWDDQAPSVVSGLGTRTPMVLVSPYARPGVYSGPTTNVSVLAFVRRLFGLPALSPFEAASNDLFGAFNAAEAPLPPPRPPRAPTRTLGFYGASALSDPPAVAPGEKATVTVRELDAALEPVAVNQTVSIRVICPAGVLPPNGTPGVIRVVRGTAVLHLRFPEAGYYRFVASGPSLRGDFTLDVGVSPSTP